MKSKKFSLKVWIPVFTLVFITLAGCRSDTERVLEGMWSIDDGRMIFNGREIGNCMLGNIIHFEKDKCTFPSFWYQCNDSIIDNLAENEGVWTLEQINDTTQLINFITNNDIFYGKHEIYFEKDPENRLLKMIIKSKKIYLKCTKGLFDYNRNIHLVERVTR